jgi:hypothetical protein
VDRDLWPRENSAGTQAGCNRAKIGPRIISELTAHTDGKEASPKTTQNACPIGQYLKLDVESLPNHVFSILIDAAQRPAPHGRWRPNSVECMNRSKQQSTPPARASSFGLLKVIDEDRLVSDRLPTRRKTLQTEKSPKIRSKFNQS